jgi:hypothetical protein
MDSSIDATKYTTKPDPLSVGLEFSDPHTFFRFGNSCLVVLIYYNPEGLQLVISKKETSCFDVYTKLFMILINCFFFDGYL